MKNRIQHYLPAWRSRTAKALRKHGRKSALARHLATLYGYSPQTARQTIERWLKKPDGGMDAEYLLAIFLLCLIIHLAVP